DFARAGFRQIVPELNLARDHDVFEAGFAVGNHVGFGQSACRSDNERFYDLAQDKVRDANYCSILDPCEGIEDVLDLARGDLFAAAFDDVVFAADEVEIAFFVGTEEIPTMTEPLVG